MSVLIEEGYPQDKALLIAVSQAEEWALIQGRTQASKPMSNYHITPHPDGWVVRRPNTSNPCLVFKTREEAIQFGHGLAQDDRYNLIIHQVSGEIQTRYVYE